MSALTRSFLIIVSLILLPLGIYAKNILIVGDSLSAGYGLNLQDTWVHLLENKLKQEAPEYHIINNSISGDTTSNGLNQLPNALKQYHPKIVIIESGGNDGLRGFPVPLIQKNLSNMIQLALDEKAKVLLLGIRLPPNYGPQYTTTFHEMYLSLGKTFKIPVVATFLDDVGGKPDLIQADGIHPNAKGQPFLFNQVWKGLSPLL